jgi:hypothetical protein
MEDERAFMDKRSGKAVYVNGVVGKVSEMSDKRPS